MYIYIYVSALPNAPAPAASLCTGSWNHIGQVRAQALPYNRYRGCIRMTLRFYLPPPREQRKLFLYIARL